MKQRIIRPNIGQDGASRPDAPSVNIERAEAVWEEYQKHHDITPLINQTAGIEPISGRIWFGESALEVHDKMIADGVDAPFYAVRVGFDYYLRKAKRDRASCAA